MRKLLLLALLLIAVPFVVYLGRDLGWWSVIGSFDIPAHLTVSLGLAIGMYSLLKIARIQPSYLRVILPVILIGGVWELGQLLLGFHYTNNFEAAKDLAIDSVGALIGAAMLVSKKGGN